MLAGSELKPPHFFQAAYVLVYPPRNSHYGGVKATNKYELSGRQVSFADKKTLKRIISFDSFIPVFFSIQSNKNQWSE